MPLFKYTYIEACHYSNTSNEACHYSNEACHYSNTPNEACHYSKLSPMRHSFQGMGKVARGGGSGQGRGQGRWLTLAREPAPLSLTFTTCGGKHRIFAVQHLEVACLSRFAGAGARVAGDKTRHMRD